MDVQTLGGIIGMMTVAHVHRVFIVDGKVNGFTGLVPVLPLNSACFTTVNARVCRLCHRYNEGRLSHNLRGSSCSGKTYSAYCVCEYQVDRYKTMESQKLEMKRTCTVADNYQLWAFTRHYMLLQPRQS